MQCFVVQSDEIEGRLDPNLYEPKYKKLSTNLKKIKCRELGDIIAFSNETWDQKTFFGDKFPYIEISEIDVISGEIRNIIYHDKKEAPSRAKMVVREDDIIVSTTRPHRGAISLIDKSKDGFIASTGFAVLRELKTNEINRDFLFYTLKADFCLNQMLQRSSGGNYPAITTEELKKIIIPLSPLPIQNQIVEIMQSAYTQKKQKEAEAQGLLDSIDDYVLDELGIKLPEVEDKRWFVVNSDEVQNNRVDAYYYQPKFEEVEKAIRKGEYETIIFDSLITDLKNGVEIRTYADEGCRYLRVTDLGKFGIIDNDPRFVSVEKVPDKIKLKDNSFLISRSGSLGLVSVVEEKIKDSILSSHIFKVDSNTDKILPKYLEAFFRSALGQIQFFRNNNGGIVPEISQSALKSLSVVLPPLDIQNKIAEEVKRRISEAERLKAEASKIIEEAKKQVEEMILGD